MKDNKPQFALVDREQRTIGTVRIDQRVDKLLTGEFTPTTNFAAVASLFQSFEDAVTVQALAIVDQLDQQINALKLQLWLPQEHQAIKIHDVQIWSDGNFSCRLQPESVQGHNGTSSTAIARLGTQVTEAH